MNKRIRKKHYDSPLSGISTWTPLSPEMALQHEVEILQRQAKRKSFHEDP